MSGASTTALMTALIRGVHSRRDDAPLFDDPYGERLISAAERPMLLDRFLTMLGEADRTHLRALADPDEALDCAVQANPAYGGVVVRSRWTEERLAEAIEQGVRQYIIVGAGFDSFVFRRPPAAASLRVIEIDSAPTQALKRERAAAAGLSFGDHVELIAADLESEGVGPALATVPHAAERPSFVSCLGVLPYLTVAGVQRLLGSIAAGIATGSELVFDYLEPEAVAGDASDPALQRVRLELATTGAERWVSGLRPEALADQLATLGMTLLDDLGGEQLHQRYGARRNLTIPRRLHLSRARVGKT